MIVFIVATRGEIPSRFTSSIEEILGASSDTLVHVVRGGPNLAKAWNDAARENPDAELFVFCHDDIAFLANLWCFEQLVALARESSTGFVGVCGSTSLNEAGTWWGRGEDGSNCKGMVGAPGRWLSWNGFGPVVAVDGVFMLCRREVWRDIRGFDESFGVPHFYDVDASFRAHLHGYTNLVAPFPIHHDSTGNFDDTWKTAREKFVAKMAGQLPATLTTLPPIPPGPIVPAISSGDYTVCGICNCGDCDGECASNPALTSAGA